MSASTAAKPPAGTLPPSPGDPTSCRSISNLRRRRVSCGCPKSVPDECCLAKGQVAVAMPATRARVARLMCMYRGLGICEVWKENVHCPSCNEGMIAHLPEFHVVGTLSAHVFFCEREKKSHRNPNALVGSIIYFCLGYYGYIAEGCIFLLVTRSKHQDGSCETVENADAIGTPVLRCRGGLLPSCAQTLKQIEAFFIDRNFRIPQNYFLFATARAVFTSSYHRRLLVLNRSQLVHMYYGTRQPKGLRSKKATMILSS